MTARGGARPGDRLLLLIAAASVLALAIGALGSVGQTAATTGRWLQAELGDRWSAAADVIAGASILGARLGHGSDVRRVPPGPMVNSAAP
ncbi:MAG TPA: hypothetical protein VGS12_10670 [Caulobacteraceae bacterium]|nr:hypothetical protein [Caulobacteraceae bacterium]